MSIDRRLIEKLLQRYLLSVAQYFKQDHDERLYLFHRKLFVETKGKLNNHITGIVSMCNPRKQMMFKGDELLSISQLDKNLAAMKATGGYACCNPDISDKHIDSLVKKLDNYKIRTLNSARSIIQDWTILREEPLVQQLINDRSIRMLADAYLECDSVLNMVTAWKTSSVLRPNHNTDSDAMQFHFDADHNRFLKIFVYLSDVGSSDGPHVFVPRTSSLYREQLPEELQRDGRFSNIQIVRSGLIPEIICGSKGTMIFADTHCLHRGTRVAENHCRYILQLQFVDSVAGSIPFHAPSEIIDMNSLFSAR